MLQVVNHTVDDDDDDDIKPVNPLNPKIGALIIRIGFWCVVY